MSEPWTVWLVAADTAADQLRQGHMRRGGHGRLQVWDGTQWCDLIPESAVGRPAVDQSGSPVLRSDVLVDHTVRGLLAYNSDRQAQEAAADGGTVLVFVEAQRLAGLEAAQSAAQRHLAERNEALALLDERTRRVIEVEAERDAARTAAHGHELNVLELVGKLNRIRQARAHTCGIGYHEGGCDFDLAGFVDQVDEVLAAPPTGSTALQQAEARIAELTTDLEEARGRLYRAHDALTRITDADDDVFTTLESTVEYIVTGWRRMDKDAEEAIRLADQRGERLADLEAFANIAQRWARGAISGDLLANAALALNAVETPNATVSTTDAGMAGSVDAAAGVRSLVVSPDEYVSFDGLPFTVSFQNVRGDTWRKRLVVVPRCIEAGSAAEDPHNGTGDPVPAKLDLTFGRLSEINGRRCQRWHPGFPNDAWTGADWANAMQGEAGEAGNVVKKLRRAELNTQGALDPTVAVLRDQLGDEIADTVIYADLLAQYYGLDLAVCIARKFNAVSEREGFPERLALLAAPGARETTNA